MFLTDDEHDSIRMCKPDGKCSCIAHNSAMVWPDSIRIVPGDCLYFTSNPLNRRTQLHNGKDLQRKPSVLYRTRVPGPDSQASTWHFP